ncbi:MAG: proline--tRNA ligase [Chloroflexi bacterium]|nr:proline--tRNA ligase [Chloroflexota bacterium]|tara:strand:- start:5454 stop:7160 length:1707 start_codon:yes stop_codon:yes gene_type:complete
MRVSKLLSKTLRDDPSEVETISHKLMLRTGMILQVTAGVYSYLPLALRSIQKIEQIIREEINNAGGQEVLMPTLQPMEIWEQTGRDIAFGDNLFSLTDRRNRKMVLAPTHEETITAMAAAHIASYRDLPVTLYQIQTKFRDEPRPRAGLLRGREFIMKDAYSFNLDQNSLDESYQRMREAYRNIFKRCGLPTIEVEADSGAIGGKDSHEFIMPAESGEDLILFCRESGYAANVERAKSIIPAVQSEPLLELQLIDTPSIKTIPDLASFLAIPEEQTLKAVFYQADTEIILVVIRGDIEVNEIKLKNHLHATDLRLATSEEVEKSNLTPGSTSPIGLQNIRTIADFSIESGNNFVAGANINDKHYMNANYPRDFSVDEIIDIATAREGDQSPDGQGMLVSTKGIEVGHVFKLGTFFTDALGFEYTDEQGSLTPVLMGCYGIGVSRILAAAIEQNHDEKGIIFPAPIAPYQLQLISINIDNEEVAVKSEELYLTLRTSGFDVLWDDRLETAGVKFNDSDLLGLPIRIIVSPRNLKEGMIELKRRRDGTSSKVNFQDITSAIKSLLDMDEL